MMAHNWYKQARKTDVWFEGELRKNSEGFIYLSVADSLIRSLFQLLNHEEADHPNDVWKTNVGGHISVLYADEVKDIDEDIKELGQKYKYRVTGVKTVEPEKGSQRVWFVEVQAPGLENLRQRYGLSKKLFGHEFHISFAVID